MNYYTKSKLLLELDPQKSILIPISLVVSSKKEGRISVCLSGTISKVVKYCHTYLKLALVFIHIHLLP